MKMPDALAPYASLIKWGLIGVLSAFLFVSGCNYGESKKAEVIATLESDKAVLTAANASWAKAAEEQNRAVESNIKESECTQTQAKRGAAVLAGERKDTDKMVNSNQTKLEAAVRDPRCNELLEMYVCPTVPLP